MKGYLCKICRLALACIVSLFVLSIITFFYKYTPIRVVEDNDATDYKWKAYSYLNTMDEGFAFLKTDKNGYNNSHLKCDEQDVDILLMGSSHMLAVEVSNSQNVGYLLNEKLPKTVYNIGMASHFLNTSVSNLKSAVQLYNPKEYIIIETNSLYLTEEEMRSVISDQYPKIASNNNKIINIVQSIFPATKRIMAQVLTWKDIERKTNTATQSNEITNIELIDTYIE